MTVFEIMAVNHLEELIAEWYEYKGYFVRRNIPVGKREKGGYETELDIVAYNPSQKHLVHIEASLDADSWARREKRFRKKFEYGSEFIPKIFAGMELPKEIDQMAVLLYASKQNHKMLGGGRLVLVGELLQEIFSELDGKLLSSAAVPEHLLIIRSFQFVSEFRDILFDLQ